MRRQSAHGSGETPGAPALPLATGLLFVVPLVLGGNALGAVLRYPEVGAAVLYPPYAVLTAALVVSRRRDWVWYLLAGLVAHVVVHWPHWSLSWVLVADLANIARVLTAVGLMWWLFDGPPRMDGIRALSMVIVCVAVVAPAVGATIGAADVRWHGASTSYAVPWREWFESNALTGLLMFPAFHLVFRRAAEPQSLFANPRQMADAIVLGLALFATCVAVFQVPGGNRSHLVLWLYAPLPFVIWSAIRFGPGGASLSMTIITYAVILAVDRGAVPLFGATADENIFSLQMFVVFTATPVLCLASLAEAGRGAVQLYRALLASIQDHVAILEAGGVVVEVNDAWQRFASASSAARFHRLNVDDDYLAACQSAASDGDTTAAALLGGLTGVLARTRARFEVEYDLEHEGRKRTYAMSVEPLERTDGGAVVMRRDVTTSREAQVEIETQRAQLHHLARVAMLGQLSGALAHELNQPLAAILANAEVVRRLLLREGGAPALDPIIADIITDGQRAAAVIQRLRALFKPANASIVSVQAGELVSDVLSLSRTELIRRHVKTVVGIEPDLSPLQVDKIQIQQVLLNLILNACEAMSEVAPTDRVLALTVSAEARGHVCFAVRDSGPGIPLDLKERLFDAFVTTKSDGLGLGLSICRTIVAGHGGRMWAENNADRGATFRFLLPMAVLAKVAASAER